MRLKVFRRTVIQVWFILVRCWMGGILILVRGMLVRSRFVLEGKIRLVVGEKQE